MNIFRKPQPPLLRRHVCLHGADEVTHHPDIGFLRPQYDLQQIRDIGFLAAHHHGPF